MPNRRHLALAVAGAIALLCPSVAAADDSRSEADRQLRAGLMAYERGEYERAIRSFHAGYAAEPRREFLFAIAQAERLRGDCAAAIVYYRRFLSRNPPERQVAAATEQLEQCKQAQSSGPAASRGDREKREVRPVPTPARASPAPAAWYRDPVGGSLLAGGAGLLIAAGAYYLSADAASDAARRADSYAEFDRQAARAASRQQIAIGLTVAGSALVGGAIYRYVSRRRPSERAPAAGLALTPGGGIGLAVGGRF